MLPKYQYVHGEYRAIIARLRKDDPFVDNEEIFQLQDRIDDWGSLYVMLFGSGSCGLYAYMRLKGHIEDYFLLEYRTLHRFNQNNWENLDYVIKR